VVSVDFFRSTLAETIALHHRVKEADPTPVLDAAAATARVQEGHRTLLHVICDIVETSVADRA
jgi:hypothetical protein